MDRRSFLQILAPKGYQYRRQLFGDALHELYYRFLETDDEYFDYAPAMAPPPGRWSVYVLGLPDAVLRKVYRQNAARSLGINVSGIAL